MTRKTIASLEAELNEAQRLAQSYAAAALEAQRDMATKEKVHREELAKVSSTLATKDRAIAALKAELFNALQITATQKGYITRTLEDDSVRELGAGITVEQSHLGISHSQPMSRRSGVAAYGEDPYNRYGRSGEPAWHDL